MEEGERIGLIGRNGSGKSSLLAAIAGTLALDGGEIRRKDGLHIVRVAQEPVLAAGTSLREVLQSQNPTAPAHKLDEYLQRLGLDPEAAGDNLSGGEAKRAALALALALEPELLLLDEPTNHLDIEGIQQLEGLLLRRQAIVITHDRAFLDRVATRIVELDRGILRSYPGNFSSYEALKAAELASEDVSRRKFDRFWAQEEAWIRKGVEARRTRNEGRVRRLEHLREARAARRERSGNVKLAIGEAPRSGKLVAELQGVSKSFSGRPRPLVRGLDLLVSRGDRIGLIGPNGAGKTTLIRLILGTLAPDAGRVRLGTNVQAAYFDQMREALDGDKTVAETISPGSEWVELPGGRKHVMSYLGDFLFPPRRAAAPVRMLSGGERNRLLLARLFARPANVLVLDEPTNDLDIESLELLEAALQDYSGTLLLVSHDRTFLDNVITQTLAAEGDGTWKEYVGGYADWLRQRPAAGKEKGDLVESSGKASPARERKPKLSYRESRELESLPGEIAALEFEQKALATKMSDPAYYRQPPEALRAEQARSAEIEKLLVEKLERWEALESLQRG
jgi:ATP-binding cassette subfamily F protein uup